MYFSEDDQEIMRSNIEKITKYHEQVKDLKLIGHRGMGPSSNVTNIEDYINLKPENTIESFKQAIILGVDGIEFDLFNSKDHCPMVIHSDQLWLHVHGAARKGSSLPNGENQNTYIIGNKTVTELKQLSVGSNNETIPKLIEVLELAREANSIRRKLKLADLILNVEFKNSKISKQSIMPTVDETLKEIQLYATKYPDSGICFENIYFCSFNHDALIYLIKTTTTLQIKNINIVPIIKTATLFGKDNVNPNYIVREGVTEYDQDGLNSLKSLFLTHNQEFIAYDVILWDVYLPLIELIASKDKQLHTSTSDYRTYDVPGTFCVFLLKMSNKVSVCFKCDAVDKAMDLLTNKAELLNKYRIRRQNLEQQSSTLQSLESSLEFSSQVLCNCLPKPTYEIKLVL